MKVDLSPYEKAVNILNGLTPRQDRIITEALDDLISQRDAARSEVARLTAEVEAMRAVEASSRRVVDHWRDGLGMIYSVCSLRSDLDALDALRARKVGG